MTKDNLHRQIGILKIWLCVFIGFVICSTAYESDYWLLSIAKQNARLQDQDDRIKKQTQVLSKEAEDMAEVLRINEEIIHNLVLEQQKLRKEIMPAAFKGR